MLAAMMSKFQGLLPSAKPKRLRRHMLEEFLSVLAGRMQQQNEVTLSKLGVALSPPVETTQVLCKLRHWVCAGPRGWLGLFRPHMLGLFRPQVLGLFRPQILGLFRPQMLGPFKPQS